MNRSVLRALVAPVALVVAAGSASGAVGFHLTFEMESWSFDNETPNYNLFPEINSWWGFSDPDHPANAIVVQSPNDLFEGSLAGSGSFTQASPADVLAEANSGWWSVSITDGQTGDTSEYEFEILIDSDAENLDYWRTPVITSHTTGATIPQNPTFEWSIDPAVDPTAEYDQLLTQFFGPNYYQQFHTPDTTSWSPVGLAPADDYVFAVRYRNNFSAPSDFVELTSGPNPLNGADPLEDFSWSFGFGNLAAITGVDVVPAPGTIALAGAAGLVAIRRRR